MQIFNLAIFSFLLISWCRKYQKRSKNVCLLMFRGSTFWFCVYTHRSDGKVRMVKKCRTKLKALWERSHQELQNEPPHDIAHPLPQNPFLASLIQTRSRGWPERDFGVIIHLCHVGARFEALDALIFIVPSVSSCIFFTLLDFPLERCGRFLKGQFFCGS